MDHAFNRAMQSAPPQKPSANLASHLDSALQARLATTTPFAAPVVATSSPSPLEEPLPMPVTLPPAPREPWRSWWRRVRATLMDRRYWPFYIGTLVGLLTAAMLCIFRPAFVQESHPLPFFDGRLRWWPIVFWSAAMAVATWSIPTVIQHVRPSS
jgi:hypothetical protein